MFSLFYDKSSLQIWPNFVAIDISEKVFSTYFVSKYSKVEYYIDYWTSSSRPPPFFWLEWVILSRESDFSWSRSYQTFFLRQRRIFLFFAGKLAFLLHTEKKLLIEKWPSLTPTPVRGCVNNIVFRERK